MIITACAYFAGIANPNYVRHHRAVDCKAPAGADVLMLGCCRRLDLARALWLACCCGARRNSGRLGEVLVTSAQIRAARGLLDWTVRDLAERLLNARQVFDEDGTDSALLLAIEDVTERRDTEREKDELLQQKEDQSFREALRGRVCQGSRARLPQATTRRLRHVRRQLLRTDANAVG
jgi:hypothetical protein